jgi:polyribonucleotide nucleotidyltransferase
LRKLFVTPSFWKKLTGISYPQAPIRLTTFWRNSESWDGIRAIHLSHPAFTKLVREISDVQAGMVLEGVVTNVTKFGAFVDIGVHQDGLVHISELSNRFIKEPQTL